MSTMHYHLAHFGTAWVLLSEDVPVGRFNTKDEGVRAANEIVKAAQQRGDYPILFVAPSISTVGRIPASSGPVGRQDQGVPSPDAADLA